MWRVSWNFQAIVDLVGDKLREVLHTGDIGIDWFDTKNSLMHYLYAYEHGEKLSLNPSPLKKAGVIESMMRTRSPLLCNSVAEMDAIGIFTVPGTDPCLSALFVPIIGSNQVIGQVTIYDFEREHAYSESDVRLLQTVAASMGVALENARLFEETQRLLKETDQRAAELSIINSVSEGLVRELNFQSIIDLVGEKIRQVFEVEDMFIGMFDRTTNILSTPYYLEHGERFEIQPIPLRGMSRWVIANRSPLVINENFIERSKEFIGDSQVQLIGDPSISVDPTQSLAAAPIWSAGEVIGLVMLYSDEPHSFPEAKVNLLATLTANLGVALQNARLFDETQRLLKETDQRAAELSIINSVSEGLVRELNFQSIIDLVGEKIQDVFSVQDMMISLYDRESNILTTPFLIEHGDRYPVEPMLLGGMSRWVIENRRTLVINENYTERVLEYAPAPALVGDETSPDITQSLAAAPIWSAGEVIGLVMLYSTEIHAFPDARVNLLATLTANLGVALQNARLFDETQRRAREMAALAEVGRDISSTLDLTSVMERIAVHASELLESDSSAIYLPDQDGQTFRAIVAVGDGAEEIKADVIPLGKGILGDLALRAASELVNDAEKDPRARTIPGTAEQETDRLMAAPLLAGDKVIGLMAVWRSGGNLFIETELSFLTGLARQAAVAIENARLFTEGERRADMMATVAEVGRQVSSTLDLQAVLETVAGQVHRLFAARDTIVRMVETDETTFHTTLALGRYRDQNLASPVYLGQGISGSIAQSGAAEVVEDLALDPRAVHVAGTPDVEDKPETMMCAPLMTRGKAIGLLSVYRDKAQGVFSQVDLDLLVALTRQAAVAIENARLYEEAQRQARESDATSEILSIISSTPSNVEPVLQAIAEKAAELCKAEDVVIVQNREGKFYATASYGILPHSGTEAVFRSTGAQWVGGPSLRSASCMW